MSVFSRFYDKETNTVRLPVAPFQRAFLPIGIVILGAFIAFLLFKFRPSPPKGTPASKATIVSTVEVKPESIRALVSGYGTVEPKRKLILQAQVSGHVVALNDKLEVGSIVNKDELLLQIDPRDYEIQVKVRQAAVARSTFELELEQGNQVVAKREWEILGKSIKKKAANQRLALREPQLAEKKAGLEATKSNLEKAKLDLSRTELRSPFPALVINQSVALGSYVSSQTNLAELVSTETFFGRSQSSTKRNTLVTKIFFHVGANH